jgi:hypothetical protein
VDDFLGISKINVSTLLPCFRVARKSHFGFPLSDARLLCMNTKLSGLSIFFFLLTTCFVSHSQNINGLDTSRRAAMPEFQFGIQVAPYFLVPFVQTPGAIRMEDFIVRVEDFSYTNPDLRQIGFFLNYHRNKRLSFRLDATLLDRRFIYFVNYQPGQLPFPLRSASWHVIAPTVGFMATGSVRLLRNLHVGAGLGTQLHFVQKRASEHPDFGPIFSTLNETVVPATWHTQSGVTLKLTKWSFGIAVQQSLNSFIRPAGLNGEEYDFGTLNTRLYLLNVGYVLAPRMKPRKKSLQKMLGQL